MSFLRVPLFTLISYYLLLHLGFCKTYQNCLVALIKNTTVRRQSSANGKKTLSEASVSNLLISRSALRALLENIAVKYCNSAPKYE